MGQFIPVLVNAILVLLVLSFNGRTKAQDTLIKRQGTEIDKHYSEVMELSEKMSDFREKIPERYLEKDACLVCQGEWKKNFQIVFKKIDDVTRLILEEKN